MNSSSYEVNFLPVLEQTFSNITDDDDDDVVVVDAPTRAVFNIRVYRSE